MGEENEETKAPKRRTRNRRRLNITGPGKATSFMPTSGTILSERYRLDEEIGRGGMGVVYKAYDQELEIPVAIKLLPPELASSKRAINDLKREAVLAMRLRHPGIMALYHFDDSEDVKYLVMELLVGGTIDDRLAEVEEGYLSVEEVIDIAQQLASAVDYAHAEKVIHRDIKPNNIFLHEKDGVVTPRIMDFGIARQIKDCLSRVSNQDSAGTLFYMSPEQLQGKPVDNRADIYSLAATYYECLSGAPPFHTGSVSFQVVNKAVDPIEGLPEHVNEALLKALAKDPEERFSSATEFAQALAEPQEAEEVPPPPPPPPPEPEEEEAKAEVEEPPPLPPKEENKENKENKEKKEPKKKEEPKKQEKKETPCMQRGCSCLFWLIVAFIIFGLFCYLLDEAGVFDTTKPTPTRATTTVNYPTRPAYRPPVKPTYRPTKSVYDKPIYKPTYRATPTENHYSRVGRLKANALQLASEGRAQEAVSVMQQLKKISPATIPSMEPVFEKLVEDGKYQEAINTLVLFDELSKDPDVWTELGKEANDAQKSAPAAKCFSKAISLSADAAEARYLLAQICLQKGKKQRAKELLEEACLAQPWNTNYRAALEKLSPPTPHQHTQQNTNNYGRLLQQSVVTPTQVPKGRVQTMINVHKDPNVHVLKVLVTYQPVNGSTNSALQNMEAELFQKTNTIRSYGIEKDMPVGQYTVIIEVTGRNAIFKNKLPPRKYPMGVHTVGPGRNGPVLLRVQAPSLNDGGGY